MTLPKTPRVAPASGPVSAADIVSCRFRARVGAGSSPVEARRGE